MFHHVRTELIPPSEALSAVNAIKHSLFTDLSDMFSCIIFPCEIFLAMSSCKITTLFMHIHMFSQTWYLPELLGADVTLIIGLLFHMFSQTW